MTNVTTSPKDVVMNPAGDTSPTFSIELAFKNNQNFYHGWMKNSGKRATLFTSAFNNKENVIYLVAFAVCGNNDNFSRRTGRQISRDRAQTKMYRTLFPELNKNRYVKDSFLFHYSDGNPGSFPKELANFLDNFVHNSKKSPLIEAMENSWTVNDVDFDFLDIEVRKFDV